VGDSFNELVRQLSNYDVAVDEAFLHGLLTGYATIPGMDSGSLFATIAGEQPLADSVIDAVLDNINSLAENLSSHTFQARFDVQSDADAKRWLKGYTRAVEIHEDDWKSRTKFTPMPL